MQWNGNESESPWVCFVGVKLSCYCKQTGRSAYKGLHELKNKVATCEVLVGGTLLVMMVAMWAVLGKLTGILGLDKLMTGLRLMDWVDGKGLRLMDTCFEKKISCD